MSTQITEMFKKSNERMTKIMKGSFKCDDIAAAQREFEGQIKLINAVISAHAVDSKNRRAWKKMENMNLLDGSTAIDLGLGDPEVDHIKCPDTGQLKMRSECLSHSGKSENIEGCKTCEHFSTNRNILLGEKLDH